MSDPRQLEVLRAAYAEWAQGEFERTRHVRPRRSGLPVESAVANIVVMRGERIARFEQYWDRDEARANAGLRPAEGGATRR